MKKRYTFFKDDRQIDVKDKNRMLKAGEGITLKSKRYTIISVDHVEGNEYTVEVE